VKPLAKLAVAAALVAGLASSQAAYASLEDRGEYLFREGVRLASDGNYLSALVHFERAMAYTPMLNVLWNIACCHVVLGNRDLAVACLDRYMEHDEAFQESAEMQSVVADIAAEPANMPDVRRRGELWDRVAAASLAIEKGEATTATAEQRRYGTGDRRISFKTGDNSTTPEGQRALFFHDSAVDVCRTLGPADALSFMERVLAYVANACSYRDMAWIHLKLGNRDLALAFLDLFLRRMPRLPESDAFQTLMRDIADAPLVVPSAAAQGFADRLYVVPCVPSPAVPLVHDEVDDDD
jgi:tetratricopeptide (TPR) repeat protein